MPGAELSIRDSKEGMYQSIFILILLTSSGYYHNSDSVPILKRH